jgi:hypothetical protein
MARGKRFWHKAAFAAAIICSAGLPAGAQVKPAVQSPAANVYNEELLHMSPEARAAKLATFLGQTCIGTKPFLMGVTREGPAKGYAYWSVECAGSGSFMIQLAPDGEGAAIDCKTLKENGQGRECYKAF